MPSIYEIDAIQYDRKAEGLQRQIRAVKEEMEQFPQAAVDETPLLKKFRLHHLLSYQMQVDALQEVASWWRADARRCREREAFLRSMELLAGCPTSHVQS